MTKPVDRRGLKNVLTQPGVVRIRSRHGGFLFATIVTMQIEGVRMWAFWRRIEYGVGYFLTLMLLITGVYFLYFYQSPTCFDTKMNGEEIGIDCGGSCTRICSYTVQPPHVLWAKSFPANQGEFNAVAYVENKNQYAGTPELRYTFTLRDDEGVIATRAGTTVLPPDSTYPVFAGRIATDGRIPTQTSLTLEPAEMWLPYAFGRAQFSSSNLELKDADSRPRLNARLENTELTPAKNIEVVATIFDALGNPLTASQTFIEELSPRGFKDVTFTWAGPIAKTLRSCTVPTDVIMAIDLSGSMNNDSANPPEPVTSVLQAARSFVSELNAGDQVGVVTFASTASLPLVLTASTSSAINLLPTLTIDSKEETGSTNTGAGLLMAKNELESSRHNQNARKVVVLLTDGLATAPGDDPTSYALEQAQALKATDTTIFTIGLGSGIDKSTLQAMASAPSQAFIAPSTDVLTDIYESITAAICEEGAARIDVIPKTGGNFAPLQ